MKEMAIVHYYEKQRPDLDAMVLKYVLDACIEAQVFSGVSNDRELEWDRVCPIWFEPAGKKYPGGATEITLRGNRETLYLPAPLPTMNHLIRVSRFDGGIQRIKQLCYGLVDLSYQHRLHFKILGKAEALLAIPDKLHVPGYVRPMTPVQLLERYHKYALGHRGLPVRLKKALTANATPTKRKTNAN